MRNNLNISIFGLGYVGLPLAIKLSNFFNVLGFDKNKQRIKELKKFLDKNNEVSSIQLKKSKLQYSVNIKDLKNSNIFIVTVPTPVTKSNQPDLKPLLIACKDIGKIISKGSIVIFESTVYPGVTEEICGPEIKKNSHLIPGKDFYLGYSPERINPGDKVHSIDKITKVVSGDCNKTKLILKKIYGKINSGRIFIAKNIKTAEAAKVIENTQRDINVAFINEITKLFKKIDINIFDVLKTAGTKWNFLNFQPGFVGGHCIGVDPYYLTHAAEQVKYNPTLILAGRRINDNMSRYMVKKVIQKMIVNGIDIKKSTVGVMGITFKENCPDVRNTKVADVVYELRNWGVKVVVVVDPWADQSELHKIYDIKLGEINTTNKVDSLIVAVGHNEFRSKSPQDLKSLCKGSNPVLADVKSIYKKDDLIAQGFSVFRL